jgi:hypothetical protein
MAANTVPYERTYAAWAEAFMIFARYQPPDRWCDVVAEHDALYAGPTPDEMTPEDRERLERLGWRTDPNVDGWKHST